MADDQADSTRASDQARLQELAEKHGGLHPGMTSPDSTTVALDATTGKPDENAAGTAGPPRTGRPTEG